MDLELVTRTQLQCNQMSFGLFYIHNVLNTDTLHSRLLYEVKEASVFF
jgi:hypothetical protein